MPTQQSLADATGRRKEAAAHATLVPGTGLFTVNGRTDEEFFRRAQLRLIVRRPLEVVEMLDKVDVHAAVKGGGLAGAAGAVRHAIARALCEHNAALRPLLKKNGFLTRDPRTKERKKPGQRGARARFQFSKR